MRAPKTRNNNTMTESAFWSMIRSTLRQKSRWWKPIYEAKLAVRRPYKGKNKRQKWEYKCDICKKWWPDKGIHVDHITQVGSLLNGDDLKGFVERLFCETEGLRVLCKGCHKEVTKKQRDANKRV